MADKKIKAKPKTKPGKMKLYLGRPQGKSDAELRAFAKLLLAKLKGQGQ